MTKISYEIIKHVDTSGTVVEIGSRLYHGQQDVKKIIQGGHIGVDMLPGKNVDIVCNCHDIKIDNNCADMIISCCMLEHDADPQKTVEEIKRLLKPNGRLLIIAPFNWSIHGYPNDFWRFTQAGLKELFKDFNINTFQLGKELSPYYVVGYKNVEIDENFFILKYQHQNGPFYYFLERVLPPFVLSAWKLFRYGRLE